MHGRWAGSYPQMCLFNTLMKTLLVNWPAIKRNHHPVEVMCPIIAQITTLNWHDVLFLVCSLIRELTDRSVWIQNGFSLPKWTPFSWIATSSRTLQSELRMHEDDEKGGVLLPPNNFVTLWNVNNASWNFHNSIAVRLCQSLNWYRNLILLL